MRYRLLIVNIIRSVEIVAKTTKELRFDALFTEYKILKRIDESTAVVNFTKVFNLLVEDCANQIYDGNIKDIEMHKALWNNLVSDKRTRFNNPERYFNGYLPEKTLKLELVELIATILPDDGRKVAPKVADPETGMLSKSYWQYTEEDILAVTDVKVLNSVYNNMASAKSKTTMLENAAKYFELDVDATEDLLGSLQKLAGQRRRALEKEEATPALSETLAEKLAKGKHTVLSAAEVEELQRLLGK